MKKRVLINKIPKMQHGGSFNSGAFPWPVMGDSMGGPDISVNKTLKPVPREMANLEAEKNEYAVLPSLGGIPEAYRIGGNRHSNGGTPLNLPSDSFIFSDTRSLKIKDKDILKQFGMSYKKGGYTPAEIAKKYDLNSYKKVLADKDSDRIQKETAEKMISNYNVKLGQLALLQESMKGFPQGIPMIALPYLEEHGINPAELYGQEPQQEQQMMAMNGGEVLRRLQTMRNGGALEQYQFAGAYPRRPRRPRRKRRVVISPPPVYMVPGYPGMMNQVPVQGQETADGPKSRKQITVKQTARQRLPKDAIVVDNIDEAFDVSDADIRDGKVFVREGNKYKPVVLDFTQASKTGVEGYQPEYGSLELDIKMANEMLADAKKKYGSSYIQGDAKSGWNIRGKASEEGVFSLDQKEFLTRLATVGNRPDGVLGAFDQNSNSSFKITRQGKNNDYNTYGFVDPEMVEYQYWKSQRLNKDKKPVDFQNLSYTDKVQNRKNMLNFYGFDVEKMDPQLIERPKELYKVDKNGYSIISGKRGAKPKFRGPDGKIYDKSGTGRKLINGDELGIVGANQVIFKEDSFRPSLKDDFKMGMEHVDLFNPEVGYGEPIEDLVEETTIEEDEPAKAKHLEAPNLDFPAPFWLQDVLKTAAAAGNLANLKKYYPWHATPSPVTPDPTYFDPTRELAAAAEQSNIAANVMAQYTGPQQFNARTSEMQAKQAKNVSDILSKYNNLNVKVSNEDSIRDAAIMNQFAMNKAKMDTALWDNYQTVNQNFDTAKQQARDTLVNQYASALTNRAYTANLNRMYPQYSVDPTTGGIMYFTNPRELEASTYEAPSFTKVYNQLLNENPGLTSDKAADIAQKMMGMQPDFNQAMMQQYQQRGITPMVYPGMNPMQGGV